MLRFRLNKNLAKTAAVISLCLTGVIMIGRAGGLHADDTDSAPSEEPRQIIKQAADSSREKPAETNTQTASPPLEKGVEGNTKLRVAKAFSKNEEKIQQSLDMVVSIEFPSTPLREALQYLSQQHGILVRLDLTSLADVGLDGREEISVVVDRIVLKDALRLILEDVAGIRLAYVVHHGVLNVVSENDAKCQLFTRIYDVQPLGITDAESFLNMVKLGAGGRWDFDLVMTNGQMERRTEKDHGSATLWQSCLIVRQNQAVHEELETLLNSLLMLRRLNPVENGVSSEAPEKNLAPANNGGMGYF